VDVPDPKFSIIETEVTRMVTTKSERRASLNVFVGISLFGQKQVITCTGLNQCDSKQIGWLAAEFCSNENPNNEINELILHKKVGSAHPALDDPSMLGRKFTANTDY